MDKEQREERRLEALELLAEEVEKLRLLQEYKMGVRLVYDQGNLFVRPVEDR